MEIHARTTLPSSVNTPAAARAFVRDEVARKAAVPVEDLTLVVSELVTNAVVHGSAEVHLDVAVEGSHVRIEVADDSPADAAPVAPLVEGDSGRGLLLVARLAARWGVRRDGARKVVWADLAVA